MSIPQKRGLAMSVPGGLILGMTTALGLTLLSSLILAKLIESEWLSQDNVGYGIMTALTLIAFISAMLAAGKVKHRRVLICIVNGILYWGILLSITALFFGGQYGAIGETILIIMIGSVCAAALNYKIHSYGKRRRNIPLKR